MNKKIFLFCISLPHVILSCFIEDVHKSIKLVMKKTTFTTDEIKQKIIAHDNNIEQIEFTIVDNTVPKEYDSKNNSQITVDPQTRVIFFKLQEIQYKNPQDSQINTLAFKINNKIENKIEHFILPVYRLPGVKKTYKDENFLAGCFIVFSDFSLDRIFAQKNVIFYYTKQRRSYNDVKKTWTYANDNIKHYINQTNKDDVMVFSDYDFPERYEFFIENKSISLKISDFLKRYWPSGCCLLLVSVLLYAKYNPNSKIAKFLTKEII